MKCRRCDFSFHHIALSIAAILALCASAGAQGAREPAGDNKIRVVSDLLTTDNEAGVAEFSGNVRVVQGTTVILSDRLKVYYKEGAGEKAAGAAGAVEKIVAAGNVRINFEDKKAESDEAEYATDTQVLTLSGKNARVTTKDEFISGARIILYRADGKIRVESGEGKRVEAVFYDSGELTGN